MARYWAREYDGAAFRLFGPPHLTALALVALLNLAWPSARDWLGPEARWAVRAALAAVILVNEGVYHLWNLTTGQWTVQTMLPLHLCSLTVYLTPLMLLTGHYTAYEFCYFFGIGGAAQALLTPDAGRYGFPHVRFFTTMISHALMVSAPIYMTVVEGYRPFWGSLLTAGGLLLIFTALVAAINWRLGSNYMYLCRRPDTPSLIDRLGPWPMYVAWLAAIAVALLVILYLPFALGDWLAAGSTWPWAA